MGLTSPALVVVLAVAAFALLAAVLWSWPRLAGKGVRHVLLRIAAMCTLQVSVLGLIFAVVNRSAEFYVSWSDLLGTATGGGPIVAIHLGPTATAAQISVTASSAVTIPGRHKPLGGKLQTVRIYGRLSGLFTPAYVYLPAAYYRARGPALYPPVLVVISDQVTSRTSPYGAAQLSAAAAVQIAAGQLMPLILVMLPARISQDDQGCLNVPGGVQAAMFFSQDLPEAIRFAYRVGVQPSGWGLLGDSSGAYCALQLAMTNSAAYSAAIVPPGSYQVPPGRGESGGSPQLGTQDDLLWLLRHQPMQPISVLFAGPGQTSPFMSLVRRPMHATSVGLASGQWPLAPLLDWAGRTLSRHSSLRS